MFVNQFYSISVIFEQNLTRVNMVPTINVKHHFPHGRPHGLMETKPDLPSTSQRMVIALWS